MYTGISGTSGSSLFTGLARASGVDSLGTVCFCRKNSLMDGASFGSIFGFSFVLGIFFLAVGSGAGFSRDVDF